MIFVSTVIFLGNKLFVSRFIYKSLVLPFLKHEPNCWREMIELLCFLSWKHSFSESSNTMFSFHKCSHQHTSKQCCRLKKRNIHIFPLQIQSHQIVLPSILLKLNFIQKGSKMHIFHILQLSVWKCMPYSAVQMYYTDGSFCILNRRKQWTLNLYPRGGSSPPYHHHY